MKLKDVLIESKNQVIPKKFGKEVFEYFSIPAFDEDGKPTLTEGTEIESNKLLVSRGQVLISKLNPRKKRVWLTTDGDNYRKISSTEFLVLKPEEKELDTQFAFYKLQADDIYSQLESFAIGSTNSHTRFKANQLLGLEVDLPALPQQRKIAKILSTLDAQIETTEQLITKYEMVKEGLMQDLFTRGIDLSTGKLRPKYQDAPHLYKDSSVGMIPREWEVKKLKSLDFKSFLGVTFRGIYGKGKVYNLIKMGNLGFNELKVEKLEKVASPLVSGNQILQKFDFLFNTRNTPELVGKTAYWMDKPYCVPDNNILVLRFTIKKLGFYLSSYLSFGHGRSQVEAFIKGTTSVAAVYEGDLMKLSVPIPSLSELDLMFEKIQIADQQMKSLNQEKRNLKSIKQGLMQDLLSGKKEVGVDEAEEEELAQAAEPEATYQTVK